MSAITKLVVLKVTPMGAVRSNGKKSQYHTKNGQRVKKYVNYKKKLAWLLRQQKVDNIPNTLEFLTFYMPIPNNNNKKYLDRVGKLHKQKPDLDNLVKGLLDANGKEDSHIAWIKNGLKKEWCLKGEERIEFGIKE